jgi:hypothetical protein
MPVMDGLEAAWRIRQIENPCTSCSTGRDDDGIFYSLLGARADSQGFVSHFFAPLVWGHLMFHISGHWHYITPGYNCQGFHAISS